MFENGNVYYIHVDHLNTPKVVTDQEQQVVWKGDYTPFGEVNELVDTVEMNLRFPGQYEDRETGLNYNYFRSYNPAIGRYAQSDPIGLRGGLNVHQYAAASPVGFFDPYGLEVKGEWVKHPHVAGIENSYSVSPTINIDKYLTVWLMLLTIDSSISIEAIVRCTDECDGSWLMNMSDSFSIQNEVGIGPNLVAVGTSFVASPLAGIAVNAAIIDLKINEALLAVQQEAVLAANIVNAHGATYICKNGFPKLGGF